MVCFILNETACYGNKPMTQNHKPASVMKYSPLPALHNLWDFYSPALYTPSVHAAVAVVGSQVPPPAEIKYNLLHWQN